METEVTGGGVETEETRGGCRGEGSVSWEHWPISMLLLHLRIVKFCVNFTRKLTESEYGLKAADTPTSRLSSIFCVRHNKADLCTCSQLCRVYRLRVAGSQSSGCIRLMKTVQKLPKNGTKDNNLLWAYKHVRTQPPPHQQQRPVGGAAATYK